MTIPFETYRRKVLGCWLGKAVGGTLGGPWEGEPMPYELTYYDPVPDQMLPNDDLDLQVVWLQMLRERGLPVDRRELANAWKRHIHLWPGEYGVCRVNLDYGLYPPRSGAFDNPTHDGMGAAIRTELWACLAPGDPELAARLALEDACCDHTGEGIHAATFFATVESLAFVNTERDWLIAQGLQALPAGSQVRHAIELVLDAWPRLQDRQKVLAALLEEHYSDDFTYTPMNLGITVLGWLAGEGDFGASILAAVNCGQDTDCTGASLGAILGLIDPDCIGAPWLKPIGRDLVLSPGMTGMAPGTSLDAFTDQVADLAVQVLDYYGSPVRLAGAGETLHPVRHRVPKAQWQAQTWPSEAPPRQSRLASYPLEVTARYPDTTRMAPGQRYRLDLSLCNRSAHPVDVDLGLDIPEGWRLHEPAALPRFAGAPGERMVVPLMVEPVETRWRPYTSALTVRLQQGGVQAEHVMGLLTTIPFAVWKAPRLPEGVCPERPAEATLYESPAHTIDLHELGEAGEVLVLQTHVKIPFHATPRFVTQTSTTRPTRIWLDDEAILEQPGGFFCPAVHLAAHTGVDRTLRRGGYRLTIAVGPGDDAGALFFTIGYGDLWRWMEDVEYQNPFVYDC